jgi:class 3 adenylate cyclase/ABC-type transport system involved in cytochrome c biogenesis ATPase subunit
VRFDPEELREEIRAYQNAVSAVVARYDGFVAKFMSDGVLAYFGYPRAHEDDAERAVRTGLDIAATVTRLASRGAEPLAVRIGIATGLVVVGDLVGAGSAQEQAVVGETPNLAARLQALAQPGQIVLAGATRRLIGDLFRLTDLGRQAVKGFAEPVEAFLVEGIAATESRFEAARRRITDLVGRADESALLRDRLRRAWAGAGQIILLSGEAGIGKSRLAAQLAAAVASEPHTRLRYQCSPYHRDSVLHPFVVALGRAARLASEDPAETQLDKLEAILAPARIAETAPLFASLLSIPTGERYPPLALSAAQQRRLNLAALLDQLEALARQKPVLMLFEDVHWADATSLEVLDLTVERVRALPVLVLITFRPEYEAPWTGLSHVTGIALDRLAPAEVETLAERVAGRPLPPEMTAQIVAKTDGVPLFVEELTKAVPESGLLIQEPQSWRLDGPLSPFAIPATLQDSLAARLDRLAPVKEIAQIGDAIGREFSYPLLRAVAGRDEPALRAALAQLAEAELLFRSGAPPDARYTFKHALVHDTAYETLLKSRRQILHRQIADALRGEFPAVAAAEPELVAFTVFGWATWTAANPSRCAKWPSFSCAKPRRCRIAPRPWSRTAFPATPACISEILPVPMSILRRLPNSTIRHTMAIWPIGSARISAPRRRFLTPSRCGCSGESTRPWSSPTVPSPTPYLRRMFRPPPMFSCSGHCWSFCGTTPKQSR